MFIAALSSLVQYLHNQLTLFYFTIAYFLTPLILFLAIFRLWKFTLRPRLHPEEPRELPYWIPYFGHAFSYMSSGHDLIIRARAYFNYTLEPFALQMNARKMYFILNPDDAAIVYKSTTTMVFIKIVEQLQRTFLISEPTMQAAWAVPTSNEDDRVHTIAGVPNPALKSLGALSMDFWKTQTVGSGYKAVEITFSRFIADELAKEVARTKTQSGGVKLLQLTQRVFLRAGMRTFFGEKILEIDPDFAEKFVAFDDESWKLWFRWPFAKKMFANKRRLEESLEQWLNVPKEERGEGSYLIGMIEKTQLAIGTPVDDLAKILNLMIFIINTNTYKASYWALAHLLADPTIRYDIQVEVSRARQLLDSSSLSEPYLTCLRNQTPRIAALLHESLRCYSSSSSIRLTTAPVAIGQRIIPAGSVVFIPFRPLHYDAIVFGSDVDSFQPDRFIKNTKLASSQNFKPFSAGSSYCPGRNLARMEFAAFLGEFLGAYNVEVLSGNKVPALDAKRPTKGIMMPRDGEDVRLMIHPREAR